MGTSARAVTSTALPCVDDRSFPSRNLLTWAGPIALRGFRRALTPDDLPPSPRWYNAQNIQKMSAEVWAAELIRANASSDKPPPNVLTGVCKPLAGRLVSEGILLNILSGLIAGCGRPLLLQYTIRGISPSSGARISSRAPNSTTCQHLLSTSRLHPRCENRSSNRTWRGCVGRKLVTLYHPWRSRT